VRTVHEHVKPFVCEVEGCGRAFGFKKVLQRHELTHTQPAPPRERKRIVNETGIIDEIAGTGYEESGRDIVCIVSGCEWRFVKEYDLKRHMASMHKGHDCENKDGENEMRDHDMKEDYIDTD
jgi:general transcription factor IIIA